MGGWGRGERCFGIVSLTQIRAKSPEFYHSLPFPRTVAPLKSNHTKSSSPLKLSGVGRFFLGSPWTTLV